MQTIFPIDSQVSAEERFLQMGQQPMVIWFTGLSGSGKSTLASALEYHLFKAGYKVFLLDGDNVRHGLNKNLSFSEEDRKENIRRIGELTKLMTDAGLIVLSSFISPFKADRESVRQIVGEKRFIEIHVDCPIEVCEQRDVKGLYKRARSGEIKNFTGIDSPYEIPENPDVKVSTHLEPLEDSLNKILEYIGSKIKI